MNLYGSIIIGLYSIFKSFFLHMKVQDFFKILSYEEVASLGKGQGNRQIDQQHVNEFYNIIKNTEFCKNDDGTYMPYGIVPLIVNPLTHHLLDGNHRKEAAVKAYENGCIDSNARFMVGFWPIEDLDEERRVIVMLNTHSKNWSLNDYVESYARENENYLKLKNFCEAHELCRKDPKTKNGKVQLKYRYPAAMITGKGSADVLASGAFSFTEEQYELADKIHDELVTIRKKLGLPMSGQDIEYMACVWHKQRAFISASTIKKMYIPQSVKDMKNISKKKDWEFIFNTLMGTAMKKGLSPAA